MQGSNRGWLAMSPALNVGFNAGTLPGLLDLGRAALLIGSRIIVCTLAISATEMPRYGMVAF